MTWILSGACRKCGAPIYSSGVTIAGCMGFQTLPTTDYTCECFRNKRSNAPQQLNG